jgi:hypothetical protein
MAYRKDVEGDTAMVDLRGKEFYLATFDTDGTLKLATGTGDNRVVPIIEGTDVGYASSYALEGQEKVILGGTVAKGAILKANAQGKAVAASAGDKGFGRAMMAGVAGDIIPVNLDELTA